MADVLPCLSTVEDFTKDSFDYIVIGGGTAGLVLAARLSENPSWKIGVIEAGVFRSNDPKIEEPSSWPYLLTDNSYTWQMMSAPQEHADKRSFYLPTGKLLGGSSSINSMAFMRASKRDYDNWEALGNPGWNWEGLHPYFKKSETYLPEGKTWIFPNAMPLEEKTASEKEEECRGKNGPIKVSFSTPNFEIDAKVVEAFNNLGIGSNLAPEAGLATGVFNIPKSIFPDTGKRCSSVNGYLEMTANRENISVLAEAYVTRLIFDEGPAPELRVSGVEFKQGSNTYTVNVKKEAILAAGATKTPQILELSGIGRSDILQAHGISCILHLPGDHQGVPVIIKLKDTTTSGGTIPMYAFCPLQSVVIQTKMHSMKEDLDKSISKSRPTPLQQAQFAVQRESLDAEIGTVEIVICGINPVAGKDSFTLFLAAQHPFSRGSIHIQSNNLLENPRLNPNFLENPFDLAAIRALIKFIRTLTDTSPVKEYFLEYIQSAGLEDFTEDEQFDKYIHSTVECAFHPTGTATMAPRELGGVVDTSLRVYGTQNLRIVDASIFPLHIAAHPLATVYAVAEKAADIIKIQADQ